MATKAQVPVDEYLRMKVDGPDREYRDGEIVERTVGENQHSAIQWRLAGIFFVLSRTKPLFGRPELRLKVGPTDYLIPDVSISLGSLPASPTRRDLRMSPPRCYPPMNLCGTRPRSSRFTASGECPTSGSSTPIRSRLYVYGDKGLHKETSYSLPDYQVTLTADEIFGE